MDEGLDRHDTIHAIGSVLVGHVFAAGTPVADLGIVRHEPMKDDPLSDQRRFRDYGARQRRIAARLFGLLQGIGVVIAWQYGAHAGDVACRGAASRQHIICQTLNRSILLSLSAGTTVQPRQTLAQGRAAIPSD
jgi:hypothetical protein